MTKKIKYESAAYFASKWGVTRAKISQWFLAGRLDGAIKPMRDLMIPINTERPTPLKAGRKALK